MFAEDIVNVFLKILFTCIDELLMMAKVNEAGSLVCVVGIRTNKASHYFTSACPFEYIQISKK